MKAQHERASQLDWQAKDSMKYLDTLCKIKDFCENRRISYASLNGNNSLLSTKRLNNNISDKTKTFPKHYFETDAEQSTLSYRQSRNLFPLLGEAQQSNNPNKQLWINQLDIGQSFDNKAFPRRQCFVEPSAYYVGPNAFNDSANFKTFKIMDFDSDDDCQTAILSRMFKISLANSNKKENEGTEKIQENKESHNAPETKKTCDLGDNSNVQEETLEKNAINQHRNIYTSITNLLETLGQVSITEDVVEEIHRKKEIESTANKELELVKRKSAQALYKCRGYLKLQSHEEKETDNNVVLFGIDGESINIKYTSMSMKPESRKKERKNQVKHVGIQVKYGDLVKTTKVEMRKNSSENKLLKTTEESKQLNATNCTPNRRLSENYHDDETHCENVSSSDETIDYTCEKDKPHLVSTTVNMQEETSETKPSWRIKMRHFPHLMLPDLQGKSTTKSYTTFGCSSNRHVVTRKSDLTHPNISTKDYTNINYPTLYLSRGYNFASCRGGSRFSKMAHRRKTYQNPY